MGVGSWLIILHRLHAGFLFFSYYSCYFFSLGSGRITDRTPDWVDRNVSRECEECDINFVQPVSIGCASCIQARKVRSVDCCVLGHNTRTASHVWNRASPDGGTTTQSTKTGKNDFLEMINDEHLILLVLPYASLCERHWSRLCLSSRKYKICPAMACGYGSNFFTCCNYHFGYNWQQTFKVQSD